MDEDNGIAIKVENLHKSFSLSHDKSNSIKSRFVKPFKKNKTDVQKVLNGVSFEIKKGEFLGIVGRNGSGKSTLLKLLAGIYTPDKGAVQVSGKLVPFIELGVGFNPELSGKDNVFLNGALLGFSRKEIRNIYDEIVEFAELHDHMDKKLKNYSSGMQVRLAFSIAIRAKGDILVLDEVLAVGDESFQRKCYAYFSELKRENKTMILVTHSMDSVQRFCNKAMLIESGKIVEIGNPSKVVGEYERLNIAETKSTKENDPIKNKTAKAVVTTKVSPENIIFDIKIKSKIEINDMAVTFVVNSALGNMVYRWVTDEALGKSFILNKDNQLSIMLSIDNIFPDGEYDIQLSLKKIDRSVVYAIFNKINTFVVMNPDIEKRNSYWKPKEAFSYEQN